MLVAFHSFKQFIPLVFACFLFSHLLTNSLSTCRTFLHTWFHCIVLTRVSLSSFLWPVKNDKDDVLVNIKRNNDAYIISSYSDYLFILVSILLLFSIVCLPFINLEALFYLLSLHLINFPSGYLSYFASSLFLYYVFDIHKSSSAICFYSHFAWLTSPSVYLFNLTSYFFITWSIFTKLQVPFFLLSLFHAYCFFFFLSFLFHI